MIRTADPLRPITAAPALAGADAACAHEQIRARALRAPDAPAVVFGGRTVTYGRLEARAAAIARGLRALGVRPDARVGVCVERSDELVAALVGVWKAGGAYVPLDPAHPRDRLAYVAEDAGLVAVVAERRTEAALPDTGLPVLLLENVDGDGEEFPSPASLDNLAYVLYTSGSTGRPKGVMVEHRTVAALMTAMRAAPGITPGDAMVAVTTAGFDMSVVELFLPLTSGARVIVADRDQVADGELLRRLVEPSRATMMQATPATWRMLTETGWRPPRDLLLMTGGEALQTDLVAALTENGAALWNLYGPTEITVYATGERVRPDEPVTIGPEILGTRCAILDPLLFPADGEGELYVGGAGVARGYLGRPALTAERFLPDPFAETPGARMYRTGDGARRQAGGRIEYLGRLDSQVKVRGNRVEPGEVEAVLAAHAAVRHAVVLARKDAPGEVRLVAYFTGDAIAPAELRAALRRTLPEYMVPAAFVRLERFPLTPSGKVDRLALPAPAPGDFSDTPYVAPETETEMAVAEAWREVLGIDRVGRDDDFFDLGGHSLLGTRVLSRLRQRLGVPLAVRALFDHPTVAKLAAAVEAARGEAAAAQPPLAFAGRDRPLPLSHSQRRLWFLCALEPDSPFYNIPAAVRLRGRLDVEALRRALGEIVRRHEAVRTTFHDTPDGPVQRVRPAPEAFALQVADLRVFPAAWARAEVLRLAADEAETPFDLGRDLLLRALLVRVAEDEHVLVLVLHHIAGDGWSVGLLFSELAALYGAFRAGEASPLPPLPVQYPDFAAWQRAWLDGGELNAQLAYWRARLAGAPAALELPTDRPRPATQSHRGEVLSFEVPPSLTRRARALARNEGATPFMVLLAVFDLALHRMSGEDDLVVGAPVAGRARPEVEGLIGFFVNTMALRVNVSGDPSFRALLGRVREATLEAYAHQDLPFDRVVEELHPERSLGRNPVFQVAFALQNVPRAPLRLEGVTLALEEIDSGTAKFDLFLELEEADDRLRARLEYATDLWEEAGAARIAALFLRLLDAATAAPDASLSTLGALTEEERAELLALGAGDAADVDANAVPVHHRVAEQARRRPRAVAVRTDDRALTYAELDAAANRLAHHLIEHGAGPERVVGVCLERGTDLVVAALAALRAGAAYVPLDPALPPHRIAAMAADADVSVAVTVERVRARVEGAVVTVVSLDRDTVSIARHPSTDPAVPVSPDSLAYVVFTSGSTGRPKGVAVPHRGLANLVAWHLAEFGVTAEDRGSMMAGVGFDASLWEVWPYLAAGAALHVVPDDARLSPVELRDWLAREEVTVAFAPTPVAELLLDAEWPSRPRLRALLAGGDRLHARPAPHLSFALHNNYGPTEASVVATSGVVAGDEPGLPSIGRPVAGARLYVVDAALSLVPRGAPGELLVAGEGVGRGYLGRPGLTAERFVPDSFSTDVGGRLYRTGDRARWLASGELEYLGRLDEQVKIRGFRIEPGEIEGVLRRSEGVADCVVVAREDVPGEKRLVAYWVGEAAVEVQALRSHLGERLPEHMVPSAYVRLEALPRTPNGKLDRKALPAPEGDTHARRGYEAPVGETETA
ncbi:MAG TPA: amino acid adenylation domain-containing protein, partial [Longimicrobium sp.]|nr:amino acid adenylation domain-containing protein [Longimicrobium sp.]